MQVLRQCYKLHHLNIFYEILDWFYCKLEVYGAKISSWSWNKRWKNRKVGTGYETYERKRWKDGYRKWKDKLNEER